jgi:hypothetical protein
METEDKITETDSERFIEQMQKATEIFEKAMIELRERLEKLKDTK